MDQMVQLAHKCTICIYLIQTLLLRHEGPNDGSNTKDYVDPEVLAGTARFVSQGKGIQTPKDTGETNRQDYRPRSQIDLACIRIKIVVTLCS